MASQQLGTREQWAVAYEELRAVGRPLITQILAVIVEVKRMARWRRVEPGLSFADWLEALHFGAHGGKRHQDHGLVSHLIGDQR